MSNRHILSRRNWLISHKDTILLQSIMLLSCRSKSNDCPKTPEINPHQHNMNIDNILGIKITQQSSLYYGIANPISELNLILLYNLGVTLGVAELILYPETRATK